MQYYLKNYKYYIKIKKNKKIGLKKIEMD